MSTGTVEPTMRAASAASLRMTGLSPKKGSIVCRACADLPASDTWRIRRFSSARSMTMRRAGSSTGFVKNCSAPSLMALTARSMLPWPVSRTTGTVGSWALIVRSTSRPSPSGSEKSTTAASTDSWRRADRSAATLSASSTA